MREACAPTVLELCHGEASRQPEGRDVVKVLPSVALSAQVEHTAAPQAVLHAALDHQAEVHRSKALRHIEVSLWNTAVAVVADALTMLPHG